MNLSESDAAYAADQFIDYFSNLGRIDEYLRNVKLDRMSKMPTYLPGCGPEEASHSSGLSWKQIQKVLLDLFVLVPLLLTANLVMTG